MHTRDEADCSYESGALFCECPDDIGPTLLGAILGPLIFGNSQCHVCCCRFSTWVARQPALRVRQAQDGPRNRYTG